MKLRKFATFIAGSVFLGMFSLVSLSDETITTVDGRSIQLRSDGTYVILSEPELKKDNSMLKSFDDLILDSQSLVGTEVRTSGGLLLIANSVYLYREIAALSGPIITILESQLPREIRAKMLKDCTAVDRLCHVEIEGTFNVEYGQNILAAQSLKFLE